MSRVQLGAPCVRLRARGAHLRTMRPRAERPDDRPGPGVAGVRRRTGRETGPHGSPDDVYDPRQGPFHHDRMEEQGLLREIDPDAEPRAAVSLAEMATPDSGEQRDGPETPLA